MLHKTSLTAAILDSLADAVSIQTPDFRLLFQNKKHKDLMDAGEICYAVRMTLCGGKVQEGGFNKFMDNCITCDFYELLKAGRSQKKPKVS